MRVSKSRRLRELEVAITYEYGDLEVIRQQLMDDLKHERENCDLEGAWYYVGEYDSVFPCPYPKSEEDDWTNDEFEANMIDVCLEHGLCFTVEHGSCYFLLTRE